MKRGNSHVGASVSERSIKSAALLRDLNALDPYLPQRSELLLAGVPEHRVDALYPLTFESLAEGLLEHMRPHPVDYLSRLNEYMVSRILTKSNTIQSLSASLRDQWQQIDRNPRTGFGKAALHAFLVQQLGGTHSAYSVADSFNALLLRTWWMAMRRSELPRHLQVNSDLGMTWAGHNMLPNLCYAEVLP